ncbi:extracellular solute-binding protein [Halorhabdus amylolytica]|uniref:extracellular solute-binding protein n=1 Tax=Halorhabdus amylolytica TaxID=2559573 RepID=UPI0010AB2948|nr:extracellular solute-binding protein [Halorhabdus amylolytica]
MSPDDNRISKRRRNLIKTVGLTGAIGLAGCSSGGDGGDGGGGGDGSDGSGGDGGSDGGAATTEAGTTTEPTPEADTVLTYWTLFGGGDGVVMSSMIDKFNEERPLGEEVAIHRQRLPWDQYYDTLYTSLVGGEGPDFAIMHGSYLRAYDNVLTSLGDYMDFSLTDEYLDTYENFVTIDGSINALPLDYHPIGVYYNKDIFEQAGLDPESPPSNYEEFKAAGDAIVAETDNDAFVPTPYIDGAGSYRTWSSLVKQAGGQLWEEGYSAPTFNNEVGQQMTQLLYDMTGDWGWAPATSEENWGNQRFQNGNLGMVPNGTWYVNVMRELDDFNWGFFKPQIAPGHEQNATWADGHTVMMPRNPDRSEDRAQLTVDAMKWLTTQNPEWGYEAGHLPAAQSYYDSGALEQASFYDKTLKKYYEMAQDEWYFFHPRPPSGDPNSANWWDWLVDVWAHNQEPQAAIESAQQNIISLMD